MIENKISDIKALSSGEYDARFYSNEFLFELFEKSADNYPDKTALICGSVSLTYAELDARSNRFAAFVRKCGVKPSERVLLMLEKCEFLYAAMLGIIKAGCAYVPLDPSIPSDRVEYIMRDSSAKIFVTSKELWKTFDGSVECTDIKFFFIEDAEETLAGESPARVPAEWSGLDRTAIFNMCYIIYTSGTTGKPKGCILDHKNICNFVRGATAAYGIRPEDRVLQCASVSFDASLEEIWMAFANGGTLVAATKDIMRAGSKFSELMNGLGVSVISCTPTFISMAEGDIAPLRILILGGEACQKDVVRRWHKPGRTIFNSYGPTEATVAATVGELHPDRIVTIGKPLPNYRVYILDEKLQPVASGAEGELYIAGPGVARGYLNMDAEDSKRFIFTDKLTGAPICLYRTGDLGKFTPEGDIEYLGRSDTQIKLRGYRIELSEIESVLMQEPAVRMAAVNIHHNAKQLAAFVVVREGAALDRAALRDRLKKSLPPYMMPAFLDEVASLPTSVSGKIDRKALPPASKPFVEEGRMIVAPRGPIEEKIHNAWKAALDLDTISVTDDFFIDLGGHSMFAATAVSALRKNAEFSGLSVADIYKYPTIEKMAVALAKDGAEAKPSVREEKKTEYNEASASNYFFCAAAQLAALVPLSLIGFWEWLLPFFAYGYFSFKGEGPVPAAALALLVYAVSLPLVLALVVAVKWIVLGRVRPGRYSLWGPYFFRYWFVERVVASYPLWILDSTPLVNLFYRLMGASVGRNAYIESAEMLPYDLISIKAGSSVGYKTTLNSVYVENGYFIVGGIDIGENCTLGNRCVLGGDNVIGDGAGLGCLSMLPAGSEIPAGEFWSGSPAAFVKKIEQRAEMSRGYGALNLAILAALAFIFPAAVEALFFPAIILFEEFPVSDSVYAWIAASPLLALAFILQLLAATLIVNRLLLFGIKEGERALNEPFYIRYWIFRQLSKYVLNVCSSMFATIYSRLWFRAAGVNAGKNSEISYVSGLTPGLTEIGEGCFLADDASIGVPVVSRGCFRLEKTRIGSKTFIGNSAVVPAGSDIAAGCLIGVQSRPPDDRAVAENTSWLGSPAIFLPKRLKDADYGDELIFRPPLYLVALRYFIEFFKVVTPLSAFIAFACVILNFVDFLFTKGWPFAKVLAACPVMYMAAGLAALLFVAALKWILIGRFKKEKHPLWSPKIWLAEFIVGLYENLVVLLFIGPLCATPFIAVCLRILGSKIGRRCYINTPYFTEFDLVSIGDGAEINSSAILQTHLFEDRVMKCGAIDIGSRVTIGSETIVLYDVQIGDRAVVGDNSLIMKGETLPPGTRWHGIPGRKD